MKAFTRGTIFAALTLALAGGACTREAPANNDSGPMPNKGPAAGPAVETVAATRERAKALAAKAWQSVDKAYSGSGKKLGPNEAFNHWGPDANPGISAFVLMGGLRSGALKLDDPRVSPTVNSILNKQQPSGGFDLGQGFRAVYLTSVAVEALSWLRDHGGETYRNKPELSARLQSAMDYLKRSQVGAPEGPLPEERGFDYGGWAYSEEELSDPKNAGKPKTNLSTSIFAIDAASAFGLPPNDPLWKRSLTFLRRNQNAGEAAKGMVIMTASGKEVADPPANHPSYGGARYSPATSKAGEEEQDGQVLLRSYGSMTYALLRGYLHAGLKKNSPPVDLAFRWVTHNFSVENVPGFVNTDKEPALDQQGLYYQFMQMARTLKLYGATTFKDRRGIERDWRKEMVDKLAKEQKPDGSWANPADRWEEGVSLICACYALSALSELLAE